MQKVYCFVEDLRENVPLVEFNTTYIPMRGETILIDGTRYVVIDVQHKLEDNLVPPLNEYEPIRSNYTHEVILILKD